MVAAVCGGAVFPPLMGVVADSRDSTRFALCVPLAGFIAAFSFPIYLNLFERERLDGYGRSSVGVEKSGDDETGSIEGFEKGGGDVRVEDV